MCVAKGPFKDNEVTDSVREINIRVAEAIVSFNKENILMMGTYNNIVLMNTSELQSTGA